ncbi:hypothetical protein O9993_03405 [Vibrio lentus]|nr:hypothetical protein [Vibrio lentus]
MAEAINDDDAFGFQEIFSPESLQRLTKSWATHTLQSSITRTLKTITCTPPVARRIPLPN